MKKIVFLLAFLWGPVLVFAQSNVSPVTAPSGRLQVSLPVTSSLPLLASGPLLSGNQWGWQTDLFVARVPLWQGERSQVNAIGAVTAVNSAWAFSNTSFLNNSFDPWAIQPGALGVSPRMGFEYVHSVGENSTFRIQTTVNMFQDFFDGGQPAFNGSTGWNPCTPVGLRATY